MKRNSGFSLVELMVPMVIGLIIILGAGQLFLTVFQTNRQVELLSEKQAAVNFAVEGLLRDIRRAHWSEFNGGPGDEELVLQVSNRGDMSDSNCDVVEKTYRLAEAQEQHFLQLKIECIDGGSGTIGPEDLVGGFSEGGFLIDPIGPSDSYGVRVTLTLMTSGDENDMLEFVAVNRTAAVSAEASEG
ncbi:PilW family protein [Halomonas alkalicola]|uniref:Prepilin-type N-terminal cleavage/methylation domain-containing protein n=1 Tax=Halomonas alkalicola TaxID=1930622 RepID=A0ABY9H499_9GAMM|nr:prepilin-type N-terminal cleavage/methylation domain-containing protein [Halomonas alkalicola]WLI72480.1 prepilin-type N-terminal cleavage/methylation domain-containing protein [Halomonas alkalicola]